MRRKCASGVGFELSKVQARPNLSLFLSLSQPVDQGVALRYFSSSVCVRVSLEEYLGGRRRGMLQKSHHTMSRDALGGAERLPQSGDKTERQRQRGRNTEKQSERQSERVDCDGGNLFKWFPCGSGVW